MYRAIALYLTQQKTDVSDESAVANSIKDITIEIKYENDAQQVYLNGENVTSQLRNEEVGNMASKSSALPCVREKLLNLQRQLAADYDVVMDGRDIGTNILPNAETKIYLTASSRIRAERRYNELVEKGETPDIEKIEEDIIIRDKQDMERPIAPLKQAEDAVLIDSSYMSIDEVVAAIIDANAR
jgi:cytidylate kinase